MNLTKQEKKAKKDQWIKENYVPVFLDKGWEGKMSQYSRNEREEILSKMSDAEVLKGSRQALLYDLVRNYNNSPHFEKIQRIALQSKNPFQYENEKDQLSNQITGNREKSHLSDIAKRYDPKQVTAEHSGRFIGFPADTRYSAEQLEGTEKLRKRFPKAGLILTA